jgi:hypothetical protein
MSEPRVIPVVFSNGRRRMLHVEERVFSDRTSGQFESGWRCYSAHGTGRGLTYMEYFISDSGEVWKQPKNVVVGVAPEIKAVSEKLEQAMDEAIMEMP